MFRLDGVTSTNEGAYLIFENLEHHLGDNLRMLDGTMYMKVSNLDFSLLTS